MCCILCKRQFIVNKASFASFWNVYCSANGLLIYKLIFFFFPFQTSNGDVFPKTHDELDFEFLGNVAGKPWRFQTNFYGNGSTARGREERYQLWFDPTKQFHRYSILWTSNNIMWVFFFLTNLFLRVLQYPTVRVIYST